MYERFYQLLVEANERMYLTSITGRAEAELLHFRDSVLPIDLFPKGAEVLDVGSGAGFPGIPLAIERSDLSVTMLDSVNKKVEFINHAVTELGLKNARAVHKRIEELDKARKFDVVTSRAVASLNVLAEYCLPFVRVGGVMIAYKAADCEEEVRAASKAIELLGGDHVKVIKRELSPSITRAFVVIEKVKDSPSKYPRGGNKPRLKPIV